MILKRSIYVLVAPIFMAFAVLACVGTVETMRLEGEPLFACPTQVPVATATLPTTITPAASATTLFGTPTPTPAATTTPYPVPTLAPTATPVVIRPPDDFYVGDAVQIGEGDDVLRAEFLLGEVATLPASPDDGGQPRSVVVWSLTVTNTGRGEYSFFPAAQMQVSRVDTGYEILAGEWGASLDAAVEARLGEFRYEAFLLSPGETVTLQLAAYIPYGEPTQLTFILDPTDPDAPNPLTWAPIRNPYCGEEG